MKENRQGCLSRMIQQDFENPKSIKTGEKIFRSLSPDGFGCPVFLCFGALTSVFGRAIVSKESTQKGSMFYGKVYGGYRKLTESVILRKVNRV